MSASAAMRAIYRLWSPSAKSKGVTASGARHSPRANRAAVRTSGSGSAAVARRALVARSSERQARAARARTAHQRASASPEVSASSRAGRCVTSTAARAALARTSSPENRSSRAVILEKSSAPVAAVFPGDSENPDFECGEGEQDDADGVGEIEGAREEQKAEGELRVERLRDDE